MPVVNDEIVLIGRMAPVYCVASVDDAASRTGWGASLERRDGDWVVVSSGPREDACWFG